MRLPVLALGRKLVAAGTLDHPGDIFYLTWEEAQRAAEDPGAWARSAAAEARASFAHWEQLSPPSLIGSPPDISAIDPASLLMFRHFLGIRRPSVKDGVIEGHAASRGTVTGRARIIRHLDEADRLEPGDIMVCATTAPPWTALFAIASAVVTDTGGVMSHSAICAREFAIPCVVGTQLGTTTIPDGATITVDGEAGTVTILPG
jgi:pyruvate,water dikinase